MNQEVSLERQNDMAGEEWDERLTNEQAQVLEMPKISAPKPAVDCSHMIAVITAWQGIIGSRLIALIALIGALVFYGSAMYDPSNLRIFGAGLYSIVVLWPSIALYIRKG